MRRVPSKRERTKVTMKLPALCRDLGARLASPAAAKLGFSMALNRMMSASQVATGLALLAGMAGCAAASVAPSTQQAHGVRTDGSAPLYLKILCDGSGSPCGLEAATKDTADLTIALKRIDDSTVASIDNHTSQAVKLDMEISRDGRRFEHTSSCPIQAGKFTQELWAHPVQVLQVSNPRAVQAREQRVCR